MLPKPIRIILVDDHRLVRESWKFFLADYLHFKVIDECKNGNEALEKALSLRPDVMLVDINMEPMNGFEVAKEVTKLDNAIRVIGLSVNNEPKTAIKMLLSGARGYVTKTSPFEEIVRCIEEVHNGNKYLCDEIKKRMSPEDIDRHL